MCGIIGMAVTVESEDNLTNLKKIFENQKSRGTLGGGFALYTDTEIRRVRTTSGSDTFNHIPTLKQGNVIMIHHRYPTSTPNECRFNHPIANEKQNIFLIHNGVISNDEGLFKKHKKIGHRYETYVYNKFKNTYYFTDSEALLHELEEGLKKNNNEVIKAIEYVNEWVFGSYAIAFIIRERGRRIYLYSKNNPIIVYKDDKGNFYFSSEYPKGNGFTLIKELETNELGVLSKRGYTTLKIYPHAYETFSEHSWQGTTEKDTEKDVSEQTREETTSFNTLHDIHSELSDDVILPNADTRLYDTCDYCGNLFSKSYMSKLKNTSWNSIWGMSEIMLCKKCIALLIK